MVLPALVENGPLPKQPHIIEYLPFQDLYRDDSPQACTVTSVNTVLPRLIAATTVANTIARATLAQTKEVQSGAEEVTSKDRYSPFCLGTPRSSSVSGGGSESPLDERVIDATMSLMELVSQCGKGKRLGKLGKIPQQKHVSRHNLLTSIANARLDLEAKEEQEQERRLLQCDATKSAMPDRINSESVVQTIGGFTNAAISEGINSENAIQTAGRLNPETDVTKSAASKRIDSENEWQTRCLNRGSDATKSTLPDRTNMAHVMQTASRLSSESESSWWMCDRLVLVGNDGSNESSILHSRGSSPQWDMLELCSSAVAADQECAILYEQLSRLSPHDATGVTYDLSRYPPACQDVNSNIASDLGMAMMPHPCKQASNETKRPFACSLSVGSLSLSQVDSLSVSQDCSPRSSAKFDGLERMPMEKDELACSIFGDLEDFDPETEPNSQQISPAGTCSRLLQCDMFRHDGLCDLCGKEASSCAVCLRCEACKSDSCCACKPLNLIGMRDLQCGDLKGPRGHVLVGDDERCLPLATGPCETYESARGSMSFASNSITQNSARQHLTVRYAGLCVACGKEFDEGFVLLSGTDEAPRTCLECHTGKEVCSDELQRGPAPYDGYCDVCSKLFFQGEMVLRCEACKLDVCADCDPGLVPRLHSTVLSESSSAAVIDSHVAADGVWSTAGMLASPIPPSETDDGDEEVCAVMQRGVDSTSVDRMMITSAVSGGSSVRKHYITEDIVGHSSNEAPVGKPGAYVASPRGVRTMPGSALTWVSSEPTTPRGPSVFSGMGVTAQQELDEQIELALVSDTSVGPSHPIKCETPDPIGLGFQGAVFAVADQEVGRAVGAAVQNLYGKLEEEDGTATAQRQDTAAEVSAAPHLHSGVPFGSRTSIGAEFDKPSAEVDDAHARRNEAAKEVRAVLLHSLPMNSGGHVFGNASSTTATHRVYLEACAAHRVKPNSRVQRELQTAQCSADEGRSFNFAGAYLGDRGLVPVLIALARDLRVEHVDLSDCALHACSAEPLADMVRLHPSLRSLCLTKNGGLCSGRGWAILLGALEERLQGSKGQAADEKGLQTSAEAGPPFVLQLSAMPSCRGPTAPPRPQLSRCRTTPLPPDVPARGLLQNGDPVASAAQARRRFRALGALLE